MSKVEKSELPNHLNIITFDLIGRRLDTGEAINTRPTGIVTQTHQLLKGICELQSNLHLTVTRNIVAGPPSSYSALTPEGKIVQVREIQTSFEDYLKSPETKKVDRGLVTKYYEDDVNDPNNPVYASLSAQYADMIRGANTSVLILQNSNPMVSLLKAEELGYLDPITLGQLNANVVIHDIEGYENRLAYARDRLNSTAINLKLIAISRFVEQQLEALGMPKEKIFRVPNGLDIQKFDERLNRTKTLHLLDEVRIRNNLPEHGKMIVLPARRVEHKGHMDVIKAIKLLEEHGKLKDAFIVFTGKSMTNFRSSDYEDRLKKAIGESRLENTIYLLDHLTDDEVYACFTGAYISLLPSTEPEGFGYANLEAMLAGVPVITSRLGGPIDYIEDRKTGMFMESGSPNSIAVTIDTLLQDQNLHDTISVEGRKKAEEYSIANMIKGYVIAINAGEQYLPLKINPSKIFELIAQGGNTDLYRVTNYTTRKDSPYAVQTYKRSKEQLDLTQLDKKYRYLQELFSDMPGLIPRQKVLKNDTADLKDTVIVKNLVNSDFEKNTLLKVPKEDLQVKTLDQLRMFVEIIKRGFTFTSRDPELAELNYRIPDIIDEAFSNLLIDIYGDLKFVDTNWLIKTDYLRSMVYKEHKINIERNKYYSRLFRRLMFIESKFFGRDIAEFKNDPFYSKYIAQDDFEKLFTQKDEVVTVFV